jgi:hypothetical protein
VSESDCALNAPSAPSEGIGGAMSPPSHDELKKQIHRDENQIDAITNKIETSGDFGIYQSEYASRTEQEAYRQDILKCKSVLDNTLPGDLKSSHPSNRESGENK